jgi:hypothetical protein
MRYFTPRLWMAFQGPRRNAAFKTWDRRLKLYRKSLNKILPQLRPSARRFFRDALILHDGTLTRMEVGDRIADIEGRATRNLVNLRKVDVRLFVLSDVVNQYWYVLEYGNVERVELIFPGKLELFPCGIHPNFGDWGYDELTSPERKLFRHEILFASGATIVIDFRHFSFRRRPGRRNKPLLKAAKSRLTR